MKIRFTHDFRGKLTNEAFYLRGTEVDFDEEVAAELIALNHAERIYEEPPTPAQEPEAPADTGDDPEPPKPKRQRGRPRKQVVSDE